MIRQVLLVALLFTPTLASAHFYEDRLPEMVILEKDVEIQFLAIQNRVSWCKSWTEEPLNGGDPAVSLTYPLDENDCNQMQRVYETFIAHLNDPLAEKTLREIYLYECGLSTFDPWTYDPNMTSPVLKVFMTRSAELALDSTRNELFYRYFAALEQLDQTTSWWQFSGSPFFQISKSLDYISNNQWSKAEWVSEANEYKHRFPLLCKDKVSNDIELYALRSEMWRNADFVAHRFASDLNQYLAKEICSDGTQWYNLRDLALLGQQRRFIDKTKALSECGRKEIVEAMDQFREIFNLSAASDSMDTFFSNGEPIAIEDALNKIRGLYRTKLCDKK